MLASDERETFEALQSDLQRERFAAAFWRSRGPRALERWARNWRDAEQLRPRADKARLAVLLLGKPAEIEAYRGCAGGARPIEVWRWEPWHLQRQGGAIETEALVAFVQTKRFDPRSGEPWEPDDFRALGFNISASGASADFYKSPRLGNCLSDSERERLQARLAGAVSLQHLLDAAPWPSGRLGWLADLHRDLVLSPNEPLTSSRLTVEYPGSASRHTILHGSVSIDPDRLLHIAPGHLFDKVTIVGDIRGSGRLTNTFQVTHHIVGAEPDSISVDFYRRLLPGEYTLSLRVADRFGLALLREERDLHVPARAEPALPPAGYTRLTRSEVVSLDTFPSVEILPVATKAASSVRIHAITTGGPIAAVRFLVDGVFDSVDHEPPYTTEVHLTAARTTVEAIALDPEGLALAHHTYELRRDGRPFAVRFGEATANGTEIRILISLPEGETLDAVECFHGRRSTRTFTTSPTTCPVPQRTGYDLDYLRVAARLRNGDTVEHVTFLGPNAPEGIDVRLVELYVSVFDTDGKPATGLGREDFRVIENGEARSLTRVDSLDNLPINVGLLMDLSASMGRRTRLAAASARRFFENILTADDLASLMGFNHDLHRLVPFTSDVGELRHAAMGIRAGGSTRLHDGIVYALSQFTGLENRRALIVLSDGADVDSQFPFDHVVRAAVRAGVAVYPVSISGFDLGPTSDLPDLATKTGGRSFVVHSIDELDSVYKRIEEELRSQYLLVYQPAPGTSDMEFRTVRVEVQRPGLSTRNIHGYYP